MTNIYHRQKDLMFCYIVPKINKCICVSANIFSLELNFKYVKLISKNDINFTYGL